MSNQTPADEKASRRSKNPPTAIGVLLIVAGALMTGGSLGPFVGLIVAMTGIALVVVGLVRRD